jgi:hypothetical protein
MKKFIATVLAGAALASLAITAAAAQPPVAGNRNIYLGDSSPSGGKAWVCDLPGQIQSIAAAQSLSGEFDRLDDEARARGDVPPCHQRDFVADLVGASIPLPDHVFPGFMLHLWSVPVEADGVWSYVLWSEPDGLPLPPAVQNGVGSG